MRISSHLRTDYVAKDFVYLFFYFSELVAVSIRYVDILKKIASFNSYSRIVFVRYYGIKSFRASYPTNFPPLTQVGF
jgi:hypothetical protein